MWLFVYIYETWMENPQLKFSTDRYSFTLYFTKLSPQYSWKLQKFTKPFKMRIFWNLYWNTLVIGMVKTVNIRIYVLTSMSSCIYSTIIRGVHFNWRYSKTECLDLVPVYHANFFTFTWHGKKPPRKRQKKNTKSNESIKISHTCRMFIDVAHNQDYIQFY